MNRLVSVICCCLLLTSCAETRIHNHEEWAEVFKKYGIENGGFIMRTHVKDQIDYYNQNMDTTRFLPASTFKIFNSLVALETGVAPDDNHLEKWNGVASSRPECDTTLSMREAFRRSCVYYYQAIARKIGPDDMQHFLDTVRYGNKNMGNTMDEFWLDNTLKISADEQLGMMKKMYFNELPFSERSQRIVRSMMLQEETPDKKLYYKTGTGFNGDTMVVWIVGFTEKILKVDEPEAS